MQLNWNLLGVGAWLIVFCLVAVIIFDIRRRHLKMIVVHRKHHSWGNVCWDFCEFIGAFVLVGFMFYMTFLDKVDVKDTQRVQLSYTVKPLVMQTKNGQGYYVEVKSADNKKTVKYYNYWVQGAKYSIPGNNASVLDGNQSASLNAKNYPWPNTKRYDQRYQQAYVMMMVAHYKNNWRNGLGIHAGNVATDYALIRIPGTTFVKTLD